MSRLVDIDALEYNGCYDCPPWITLEQLEAAVIPPAHWIATGGFQLRFKCSACGRWQEYHTEYCGHCGRQMNEWLS